MPDTYRVGNAASPGTKVKQAVQRFLHPWSSGLNG